tara:strand:- start:1688 stop:3145 length:1458 start_codon:yes stop_codon:yes gene_type:complete
MTLFRNSNLILATIIIVLKSPLNYAINEDLKLPNLGETGTSVFSPEHEYQLGRMWLRLFRSNVRTLDDPIVQDYVENLIFQLVPHSRLEDRRLEIVLVDSPEINAFAVPGGIIGINNGLLQYAETESELASVLSHEIAHLSQRHFSRRIEHAKRQQPLTLATMLTGLVLLTAGAGDAGLAALTVGQAAAQDAALGYSRSNEAEADRIGMMTLVAAGLDPNGAASMFENMLKASKFSGTKQIPEFLRTHPLSENRIADARNRARDYPDVSSQPSLTYQLVRARTITQLKISNEDSISYFRAALNDGEALQDAMYYGLVLALTRGGRALEAKSALEPLIKKDPDRIEYVIADAEIDLLKNRSNQAAEKLKKRLSISPRNHPLTMAYANTLVHNDQAHIAEEILIEQSEIKSSDPGLWYLLAETQGLAGNIIGLHESRAEFFILNGNLDQAEKQLNYALELSRTNYQKSEILHQRLKDIKDIRSRLDY